MSSVVAVIVLKGKLYLRKEWKSMGIYEQNLHNILKNQGEAGLEDCSLNKLYKLISEAALETIQPKWANPKPGKTACYFSAEFLLGRLVYSNLYNMGLMEEVKGIFAKNHLDISMLEDIEDAALGNGGLGRLAACFLDSAATQDLRVDGYGIRYKYGLFKQTIQNGFQQEEADDWQRFGDPWSIRREEEKVLVVFGDQKVWAVPYDMPMIGYGAKTVNNLRLWEAEAVNGFDFEKFNNQQYDLSFKEQNDAQAIHSVLYPNDDTEAGKRLRLKQQYFFSSASLQSIMNNCKKNGCTNWNRLPEMFAIQLNDTHPTVAIPELLRILVHGESLTFEAAFAIVKEVFAYTNHTIMAEALEKWDCNLFATVLPEVYPYVILLNEHLRRELAAKGIPPEEMDRYEILSSNQVHMARMAVYATHSVNGVAELHSRILKEETLREWYALYPERFNNKTNGITQRRWLALCNPELAEFITKRIGDGWITNLDELEKLRPYAQETSTLQEFAEIKIKNKRNLAAYLQKQEGVEISADSIFDIQIKRLHEYKRQLLNAFSIVDLYFQLKEGKLPDFVPMTFLFGAKSAPGYWRAKGIIKYINEVAKLIENDPVVRDKIKVLFVANYNVSYAEMLIPAADVSEQISTAGTEASGTGNMKLMLNGAVTLGTYDGATVEIVEQAGEENNYIFGARVEEIRRIAPKYNPMEICRENPRISRIVNTLVDGTFYDGGTGMFADLHKSLLRGETWHQPDNYFLLQDLPSYIDAKLKVNQDYQYKEEFAKKCLLNVASAGKFSSDRTIRQYAQEVWNL